MTDRDRVSSLAPAMLDPQGPWQYPLPYLSESLAHSTLHFSPGDIQSRMLLEDPDVLTLEYTRLMMGFLLFKPKPQTIAMIGLGGGSIAKFCVRHLPDTIFRAVENNPFIIDLRDHFRIPSDGPSFSVIHDDGAQFVRNPPKQFDVLLVDGYSGDEVPQSLSSQRFYDDCYQALMPGGLLVVNLNVIDWQSQPFVERMNTSFLGNTLAVQGEAYNWIVFARKGTVLKIADPEIGKSFKGLAPTPRAQMVDAFETVKRTWAESRSGVRRSTR